MRSVTVIVFFALVTSGLSQKVIESNDYNDKLNTVETKPSARIDPYIRKALLKALSDLEESENFTDSDTTDGSTSYTDLETISTTENEQPTKANIKIHSFVVDGQSAFKNTSNAPPVHIDNKISIISSTAGNVESHVTATLPTKDPFREIFQTKESNVNSQQVRSIPVSTKYSLNSGSNDLSTFKPFRTSTTTTSTTTTTTTTTTPKPTHNEDGENIEEVNKKDVQVFQAPLVAAFTVHQDANGVPKQVIPIYQQTNSQLQLKPTVPTTFASNVQPTQLVAQNVPVENNNQVSQTNYVALQLKLQKELEEKQRVLEEQLRLLQLQQRQQEELLRKQQFILQQKEAQRQQQILFEQEQLKRLQLLEQHKLQLNHASIQSQALPKTNIQNQFQNNILRTQNSQVSILPSVSIDQAATGNQQQLPNREAVDFLIHLHSQQPGLFPLQENHLPPGINSFLQPKPIQNFHQGASFNQLNTFDEQFRSKQANRVFRQESGVGNFGANNLNYNRFNSFGPVITNRFIPFNRANQFSTDIELNQLLAQTGLNGRTHEDLNIVSKVLSLNHGVPISNVSNRLPFDSRRQVRT